MNSRLLGFGLVLAAAAWLAAPVAATCCPFCGGVMLTLTDEMKASDVVVLVQLSPDQPRVDPAEALRAQAVPKAEFTIVDVLKGQEVLGETKEIEILYFGREPEGTTFLVQATRIPDLAFNTPLPLSERALAYVRKLPGLPEKGPERLAFFQDYLEDQEDLLAKDAYDEFAKAPYAEIKELGEGLYHDKFVEWIKNIDTSTSHRRQYLTLLGICGRDEKRPEDIAMLEEAIKAETDGPKPALDATIACYLTFLGADGLPLVEDQFLKSTECSYSDTYSAIMALRFHGQEEEIIPKERLLEALRHLLDRPELADLIIPDLARWQDWSAMERLVTLFKEADDKSSWVRVPVVQYLRVCPLPEAAKHLEELTALDPEAVKRASFFVPLGGGTPKPVPPPGEADPMPPAVSATTDNAAATEVAQAAPAQDGGDAPAEAAPGEPAEAPTEAIEPDLPAAESDPADAAEETEVEAEQPSALPAAAGTADGGPPAAADPASADPAAAATTPAASASPPADGQVAAASSPTSVPAAAAAHGPARPQPTFSQRLVVLVPLGIGVSLFFVLLFVLRASPRQPVRANS